MRLLPCVYFAFRPAFARYRIRNQTSSSSTAKNTIIVIQAMMLNIESISPPYVDMFCGKRQNRSMSAPLPGQVYVDGLLL
jgi:hypothetical protein